MYAFWIKFDSFVIILFAYLKAMLDNQTSAFVFIFFFFKKQNKTKKNGKLTEIAEMIFSVFN